MTYQPPEINSLTPSSGQQMIVDAALEAIRQTAPAFWDKGRGAGKSTVRAFIAQAILDDDAYPLYTVVPQGQVSDA